MRRAREEGPAATRGETRCYPEAVSTARRLQLTDIVLGVAAAALFIVGLLRVLFFEKGLDYYLHSYAFLAKIAVMEITLTAKLRIDLPLEVVSEFVRVYTEAANFASEVAFQSKRRTKDELNRKGADVPTGWTVK